MARPAAGLLPFLYRILPLCLGIFANVCVPPNPVTVTVTVTASGYSDGQPSGKAIQSGPWYNKRPSASLSKHPYPVPPQYSSCFDRNDHPFTYTYSDGYHFKPGDHYSSSANPSSGGYGSKSEISYSPTTLSSKASSKVYSSSSFKPILYYPAGNKTSSALPTKGTSTPPKTNTTCEPTLQLIGVSEYSFNKKNTAFSLKASCSQFIPSNTSILSNLVPVTNMNITSDIITFQGFSDDVTLLTVLGINSDSTSFSQTFTLLFGSIEMPILVLDPSGNSASNVPVTGNATIYPGVSESCTTDSTGQCTLSNLIATTIGLVAKTPANYVAVNGLAATTLQLTLKLMPFNDPVNGSNFDIANGTSGWTGGIVSSGMKIKRDTTLVLGTNGQYDLQTASNSFPDRPGTKSAYIKYKFVTSEVPGGFFGTRFNDYFSVTIRSDTGGLLTYANSMNALGLGAFDASGATDWFTSSLTLPQNTQSVAYDIAVSNVADNLYDSEIIVDKVGDTACECADSCDDCPSNPMCDDTCKNPPMQSCAFYRKCAESTLGGCGDGGYPLGYGENNCLKFSNHINWFDGDGQNFVWGTMHCLQTDMVPVLQTCTATCDSFSDVAFASHPACYVGNGFCGLQCGDILASLVTIGSDLFNKHTLQQVFGTAVGCADNLLQTLSGCAGEVITVGPAGALPLAVSELLQNIIINYIKQAIS